MKRRDFVLCGSAVLLALPVVGCGDDDDGGNGTGTGGTGTGGTGTGGTGTGGMAGGGGAAACTEDIEADSTLVDGHTHPIVIPLADILSGSAGTYTLEAADGHTHDIELFADDLTALQSGMSVTKTSTLEDSHTHDVTLVCS